MKNSVWIAFDFNLICIKWKINGKQVNGGHDCRE